MYNRLGIWQSDAASQPHNDTPQIDEPPKSPSAYLSLPLDVIPTDVSLPCALYVRILEKFVLFRKQGDTLTSTRAQSLAAPSNGLIFITLNEWNLLVHSLETVAIAGESIAHSQDDVARGLRIRALLTAYTCEIEQKRKISAEVLRRIELLADELATLIAVRPGIYSQLLKRDQDPALYQINHVVNVTLYCLAIGKKQGLGLADLKLLTFAALVHNVGNIQVPADILFKQGELSPKEKNLVDKHTAFGASILKSLSAPEKVILTALHHHDRFDGHANATGVSGEAIPLFARICSIADVFDAITNHRPYHAQPMPPEKAVQKMMKMHGKFDPQILPTVPTKDDEI